MIDTEHVLTELAEIKRRLSMVMRHGTVIDVQPGMVQVQWGDQTPDAQGSNTGGSSGGSSSSGSSSGQSDPWKSPWIRSSKHAGWATENMPFKKGQTVTSISMDPDHLTGLIFPHSHSDNNPLDKNATNDAHTFRIRKPDDDAQTQGNSYQSSSGASPTPATQKAQDDDDNDVQVTRHYDKVDVRIGSKMFITHDRKNNTITVNNDKTSHTLYSDKIVHKVGDDIVHTMTTDSHTFQAGSGGAIKYVMDKDGHTFSGGTMSHDNLNVGSSHKHKGVMPGTGLTDVPIPK